jgi:tetratricopeptide (TPR) repeat protein
MLDRSGATLYCGSSNARLSASASAFFRFWIEGMPTADEPRPPLLPAATTAPLGGRPASAPAPASIPLPSPGTLASSADRERQSRAAARLDFVLVLLVLALAALLGSFPARNSDVWLHLAAGRFLAGGDYAVVLGHDPFAHTTEGVHWVNHGWLFDGVSYATYRALGGRGLVALKVLVVVILAGVLLRLGGGGRSGWLPAACTALALLAMGPRLLLQPVCLSYLFLALTLWFLDRPRRRAALPGPRDTVPSAAMAGLASYWPLLPLFAVWVNVDDWFLLGPLTVALYGLGQWRTRRREGSDDSVPGRGARAAPVWPVLAAGLTACLLSPHHLFGLTLPPELGLSGGAAALRNGPVLRGLLLSPFEADYFRSAPGGTPAGLAYFPLALLGLLSFALNPAACRSWRGVVWLAFFLLSALHARAIPFFAVVAGPVLALNLGDWAARRAGATDGGARLPAAARPSGLAGRVLAAVAALSLLAAAWPGWLQGPPYGPRQWAVEPDPSLEQAAAQIARWRADGRLGSDRRGFNTSPETANYFAWACPAEKGFLDSRLQPFGGAAADYAAVRRALAAGPLTERGAATDWRQVLRARRVDHVVLYDTGVGTSTAVLRRLAADPDEWPLLYLGGGVAVFGWRDPTAARAADPFAALRLDLARRAFRPRPEERAPAAGLGRFPGPRRGWDVFVTPAPPRPIERDEAAAYLVLFDALGPRYATGHATLWHSVVASGLVGMGGPAEGTVPGSAVLAVRLGLASRPGPAPAGRLAYQLAAALVAHQDDGPPELPLLAIRAARRALRVNPDDPYTYLLLGEAYLQLTRHTRERAWCVHMPMFDRLRSVQAAAALNQALRLKPDLPQAHASLASLYQGMAHLDLALHHLREHLRFSRAAGPVPGESERQFAARIAALEENIGVLDEHVRGLLRRHEESSADQPALHRARTAAELKLGGKALDILLTSDVADFGAQGTVLELDLLLEAGRVNEAREWMGEMNAGQKAQLGGQSYHRLEAEAAAALGDYAAAERSLEEMARVSVSLQELRGRPVSPRAAIALAVGQSVLDGHLQYESPLRLLQTSINRTESLRRVGAYVGYLRQEAEITVLRGLLALESGETDRARELFREALRFYGSGGQPSASAGPESGGRVVAEQALELLAKGAD